MRATGRLRRRRRGRPDRQARASDLEQRLDEIQDDIDAGRCDEGATKIAQLRSEVDKLDDEGVGWDVQDALGDGVDNLGDLARDICEENEEPIETTPKTTPEPETPPETTPETDAEPEPSTQEAEPTTPVPGAGAGARRGRRRRPVRPRCRAPARATEEAGRRVMATPTTVADRYRLERRLGAGGMSTVFLAMDTVLERRVAVKLLAEHLAEDEAFVARFRREALSPPSSSTPTSSRSSTRARTSTPSATTSSWSTSRAHRAPT